MADHHADAGQPMPAERTATAAIRYHKFETATRQVSMRNTGCNTLWFSFDRSSWFDCAAGTSWDDRIAVTGFWFCTQLGATSFVVNGVALNMVVSRAPLPVPEELT